MEGSPVTVKHGESGFGRWTRASRPADPRLRPLFARDPMGFAETTTAFGRWLMPPTATVTIILNLAGPFGGLPAAFVAGIEDAYSVVPHGGVTSCVDLKLTPLGAYRLLGVPMDEIAGQALDIGELLGPDGCGLAEALTDAADQTSAWARRFDLLDDFFLRRAETGPAPSGQVVWAWRRLVETGGLAPIGGLADDIGWSRRHLIARFKRQIGLPPKTVARILRFARLLRMIDAGGPVRWERMAADCGYYDQAHLNRDFREFAGTTPTDFLARRVPGGSIIGDGVNSIQDAGSPAA